MNIEEHDHYVLITELDPNKDYLALVNLSQVRDVQSLSKAFISARERGYRIEAVSVEDVDRAVRFFALPKEANDQTKPRQ